MSPDDRLSAAVQSEADILARVMRVAEDVRKREGFTIPQMAERAQIKPRQWRVLVDGKPKNSGRALCATPLRRLILIADICGLDLTIGLRRK